ncbi:LOW QUALITY PROTEIN: ankyrin and armadillo repeat-containing protein [Ciconia maguari]
MLLVLRPGKCSLELNKLDEAACLSNLVAQKNASALFVKYDKSKQELLTTMSPSWLASKGDVQCSVEIPSGLLGQLKIMYPDSNFVALMDSDMLLYYEVHQILRELAVGICCPSISSDANYHHRTSCQLPPACTDTKMGILISVDDMAEVWVFTKHDFEGTRDENTNEDPPCKPNSTEKKKVSFMQYADNMLFKLTLGSTQVELHENVFRFDAVNRFTDVIRSTEAYDMVTYQTAAEVLALRQKLLKKQLEKIVAVCRNTEYLKLMNLIPFLLGFKKKMEIPNLSKRLQPYSSKKTVNLLTSKIQI